MTLGISRWLNINIALLDKKSVKGLKGRVLCMLGVSYKIADFIP